MIDLVHMWLQILQMALEDEDYDEVKAIVKHLLEEIYGDRQRAVQHR